MNKYEYKAFISYAREDAATARRLHSDLTKAGVRTFLDEKDVRAGSRWKVVVSNAIRDSEYFIALLSPKSVGKRGYVQKELLEAFEEQSQRPQTDKFIIPVRLRKCESPHPALDEIQWVDLFPSSKYDLGLERILSALLPEAARKARQRSIEKTARAAREPRVMPTAGVLAHVLSRMPRRFVDDVQSKLERLSRSSAVGKTAVTNLFSETNLAGPAWETLIQRISASKADPAAIRRAITETAREFVCCGPIAEIPGGTILGTFLRLDALAIQFVEQEYARTLPEARGEIIGLLRKSPRSFPPRIRVGRFVTFATFDLAGGRPFRDDWSIAHILASVGAATELAGDALVTVEYLATDRIITHVPTVCDVYAKDVWPYYFQPAPPGYRYGLTVPWDTPAARPVPEVVHRPIEMTAVNRASIIWPDGGRDEMSSRSRRRKGR